MMNLNRTLFLFFLLLLAFSTACGSSDSSSSNDAVTLACKSNCTAQGNATGCSAAFNKTQFVADCQAGCDGFFSGMSATCKEKYTQMYTCTAAAAWQCSSDFPTIVGEACQTEMAAATSCQ